MTYHANASVILKHAKAAAIAYHQLTGRPLGITGELGECIAAELLDLQLCTARTPGYDATDGLGRRVQIKCRRVLQSRKTRSQRIGAIRFDHLCDVVLLVLLDDRFEPTAIYEAPAAAVRAELQKPGSTARNIGRALSVSAFKRIAHRVWPKHLAEKLLQPRFVLDPQERIVEGRDKSNADENPQ